MVSDTTRWPGRWFRVAFLVSREREDEALALASLGGGPGAECRRAGPGRVQMVVYFESRDEAAAAAARLEAAGLCCRPPAGPDPVEDDGWLDACMAPREPIRAGDFLVLDREGAPVAPGTLPIVLPPGRAFGTGEHPTTRGCLELLSGMDLDDAVVLDLGTGSGILAIAAARLGAARVLGLDNDPRVIDVAAANAQRNDVAARVRFAAASWTALAPAARFDLLLANIHRTAICRAASALAPRLAGPRRVAICSGFTPADLPRVEQAWAAAGFHRERTAGAGEWIAVRFVARES